MSAQLKQAHLAWPADTDAARWPLATALALLLEAALLAALAWYAAQPAPKPPPPLQITLVQPKPLAKPPAPKPLPAKPKPKPLPRVHHQAHPRPLPTPPRPRIQPPPPPLPQARPAMPLTPPPPPPPPPKPVAPDLAAVKLGFEGALREAIQAAVRYPEAARLMRLQGRTLVRFAFRDGHASAIRVATSSGIPPLDEAAIAAVRNAPYPPTPAALAGRALTFEIWVRFHLDSP